MAATEFISMRKGLTDMPAIEAIAALRRNCRRERSCLFIVLPSLELRAVGWRGHGEIDCGFDAVGERRIDCVLSCGRNGDCIDRGENLIAQCTVHAACHQ